MGLYHNRIQAPTKTLTADWIPEEGEIFRDSSGNFYCGDNVTASDALTPINGGGGGGETPVGIPYTFEATYNASGIANGEVRVNNATAGSITAIYIAQNDSTATDFGPVLATLSAGGLVYLNTVADDTAVAVMKVTAAVDSGTYYTLTGTYLSGVMPGDGSAIRVTIAPSDVLGAVPSVIVVSGAGTAGANGVYVEAGTNDVGIVVPYWIKVGGVNSGNPFTSDAIFADDQDGGLGLWRISSIADGLMYSSTGYVNRPWDATWFSDSGGSDPVPTVAIGSLADAILA